DVFCCALGCVTLLWLLNTRQAGDQTAAAQSALQDLTAVRTDLKTARTELDDTKLRLNAEVQQLTNQLAALRIENDDTARKLGIAQGEAKSAEALLDAAKLALNASEKKVDTTAKELAAAREKVDSAEDVLAKRKKEADALAKRATAALTTAEELAKLLRKKEDERLVLVKKVEAQQVQLDDLDAKLQASRKEVESSAATAKATASKTTDELAAARAKIKELQKTADDANATIIDLQGEKKRIADKVDTITRDTENKFAGITMTGTRVVFLVDMSGSMDKLDANTPAPQKWAVVCETVAKVMRSIPNPEKYQVVVFSRATRWLFGTGEWQPFEGEKSVARVKDALLKIKPENDTNLHAGMEMAFTLRPTGLDTIYLFSDGLPTSGEGLTRAQEIMNPPLKETERSEILARHIRTRLNNDWNRAQAGRGKVKIHSIGFFYESPDVGAFLWALSRENDGSFVGMSKP
ncbi:MAG TPA: VWA domain-containing protein, partial [Gemmataceae bacterium]|nr:VWA domain-containing protein [Gemmataceae bacterium]